MDEHHNYFTFVVVVTLFVTLIVFSVGVQNSYFTLNGGTGTGITGNVIANPAAEQEDTHGTLTSTRIIFPTDRYEVIGCMDDGNGNVVADVQEKGLDKTIKIELTSAANSATGSELSYECKAFKVLETEKIVK
jgi:hypothetical protein